MLFTPARLPFSFSPSCRHPARCVASHAGGPRCRPLRFFSARDLNFLSRPTTRPATCLPSHRPMAIEGPSAAPTLPHLVSSFYSTSARNQKAYKGGTGPRLVSRIGARLVDTTRHTASHLGSMLAPRLGPLLDRRASIVSVGYLTSAREWRAYKGGTGRGRLSPHPKSTLEAGRERRPYVD